jgi:hypothetical protein
LAVGENGDRPAGRPIGINSIELSGLKVNRLEMLLKPASGASAS